MTLRERESYGMSSLGRLLMYSSFLSTAHIPLHVLGCYAPTDMPPLWHCDLLGYLPFGFSLFG